MEYPHIDEILEMPAEDAQKLVIELSQGITDEEAAARVGLASGGLYKGLRTYLGVFKDSGKGVNRVQDVGRAWWGKISVADLRPSRANDRILGRKRSVKRASPPASPQLVEPTPAPVITPIALPLTSPEFTIRCGGLYKGARLRELLSKIEVIIDDNEEYDVSMWLEAKMESSTSIERGE